MSFFLITKFKFKINLKDRKLLFLIFINLVPIGLMFLTSMILGAKIKTMWMVPFYLFIGVLIVYVFQTQINFKKLNSFFTVFLILFIFSPFAMPMFHYQKLTKEQIIQAKKLPKRYN